MMMSGSEKVIRLPGSDVTTALHMRDSIAGMCHIPEECHRLFAIWIATPSLAVQLENDMKPLRRMERWPQMLELYTVSNAITNVINYQYVSNSAQTTHVTVVHIYAGQCLDVSLAMSYVYTYTLLYLRILPVGVKHPCWCSGATSCCLCPMNVG